MNKLHIALTAAGVVVLVGLTALAFNKYQHQSKGLTLSQAISQRDAALIDLKVQKQINQTNQQAATNQFKADQQALCQFIVAHVNTKVVTIPSECTAQPL